MRSTSCEYGCTLSICPDKHKSGTSQYPVCLYIQKVFSKALQEPKLRHAEECAATYVPQLHSLHQLMRDLRGLEYKMCSLPPGTPTSEGGRKSILSQCPRTLHRNSPCAVALRPFAPYFARLLSEKLRGQRQAQKSQAEGRMGIHLPSYPCGTDCGERIYVLSPSLSVIGVWQHACHSKRRVIPRLMLRGCRESWNQRNEPHRTDSRSHGVGGPTVI